MATAPHHKACRCFFAKPLSTNCDELFPKENSAYPVMKWLRVALFPKYGCHCGQKRDPTSSFYGCTLQPVTTVQRFSERL